MRILLVSQMWPSPEQPDLGSFLVPLTRELEALGHEVEVSSISQRGGSRSKYLRLVRESRAAARRFEPDVVFAHFLFPSGAAGALAARAAGAPLVVMAHGQDVANLGRIPGVTAATRWVLRRSSAVIANSRWLADRLVREDPLRRAEDRGRRLRRGSGGLLPPPGGGGAGRGRLGRRRSGLPLRRLADRAQERRPARRRLRVARPGQARLRRRRAVAGSARGPRRRHLGGTGSAVRRASVGRGLRRALPALPAGAIRAGDAGGDGDGAQRRRDDGRRAARVRHPRGGRSGRSRGFRCTGGGPGASCRDAVPQLRPRARPRRLTT